MNAVLKVLLISFLFSSSIAYLDIKDFGKPMKKMAYECHDICSDVTGVTDEQIQQMREGNFIDDEKMKRYVLCLWRVSKLMDRNMKINVEKVEEILPQEMRDENIPTLSWNCLDDARKSGLKENYEKIYEVEKCLFKLNPEKYIMF